MRSSIAAARTVQQTLLDLLVWLPRLGLIREACQLLDTAQTMEREHPIGPGAVTRSTHAASASAVGSIDFALRPTVSAIWLFGTSVQTGSNSICLLEILMSR